MPVYALLVVAVFEGLLGAVLFGSAGRLDLPWFWAVMGVHTALLSCGVSLMDKGLLRERVRPGAGGKDRRLRLLAMPFILAHMVVAGLDVGRYGWSGDVPTAVHALGLAGYALGMGFSIWAMSVNKFFSPVVRIQEERGHHVVTGGPYRFIRHPGYAGVTTAVVCGALALGSYWSLLPVVPVFFLMVRRAVLEDRFLRENLAGYTDYARGVKYGLLPGIW